MRYRVFAGLVMLVVSSLMLGQATGALVPLTNQAASTDETPIIPHGLMGTTNFTLTLQAANGETVKVEDYRGHPVVLLFWASYYKPSVDTLNAVTGLWHFHEGNGAAVFLVDRELRSGTAENFLQQRNITLKDYHYDEKMANATVQEKMGSAPEFMVIDSEGTVVYQNNPYFLMEFTRASLKAEGKSYPTRARNPVPVPLPEPKDALVKAIDEQQRYTAQQASYGCRYTLRADESSPGARARKIDTHDVYALFLHGADLQSGAIASDGSLRVDRGFASVADTYRVWASPLLPIILQHSILGNKGRLREKDGSTGMEFTFRGDPNFVPKTDEERIARSLQGMIKINDTFGVFTSIYATAAYDLVDGDRFLLGRNFLVLDYTATRFEDVYFPSAWSVPEFRTVSASINAPRQEWNKFVLRTFVRRDSCQPFQPQ